jgi:murein peptide amidase A
MPKALWIIGLMVALNLLGPATAQATPTSDYRVSNQIQSNQKQTIPVYRFGQGTAQTIFLFATFHGDEPQGAYMLEQLMQELANKPQYYANKTIFCVPVVNPDGYRSQSRTNSRKVDLNRNFPTRDYKAQQNKGTRYYAGAKALSEPESRLVYELIQPYLKDRDKKTIKILSIHGPLAVVNYDGPASDLAKVLSAQSKLPVTSSIGYATPGSFGTYYGKEQGIPVITFETGYESPENAWKKYRSSLLALLQYPEQELEPQSLATPAPLPTAIPTPTATPTAKPRAENTPEPTQTESAQPPTQPSLSQPKKRWWLLGPTPTPLPTPQPTSIPTPIPTPLPTATVEILATPTPQPTPLPTATPYQPGKIKLPNALSKQAYILVSKRLQVLEVFDQNQKIASIPVSTGLGTKDTPEGTFRIISKVPFPSYYGSAHLGRRSYPSKHPNNPLGTRWMQINVGHYKTRVAIGLHGTDEPNLIGKAVSGGCVRMHNADVEQLFKIFRVGMKVIITAK